MARAESTDYLQGFRFHVRTASGDGKYEDGDLGEAGFNSVSIPELSAEASEYREGHDTYTKKFPGVPTVGDVSLQRGVTRKDTSFYDWMYKVVNGGAYRTDLTIYQYPRSAKVSGQGKSEVADLSKARTVICYQAFPTRMKPAGDLEATSSDVSMAELDVAIEYFELVAAP